MSAQDDIEIRELTKSISGHKTWLTRYEKDFNAAYMLKSANCLNRLRSLYEKIESQTSRMEDKYEDLITLREKCELDNTLQWQERDQISESCKLVLEKLEELEKDLEKHSPLKQARNSRENEEMGERAHESEASGVSAPSQVIGPPAMSGGNACLLYTSPSPRDGLLSRMPSSA